MERSTASGLGPVWRGWDKKLDAEVDLIAVTSDPDTLPEADYAHLRGVEETARAATGLPAHPGIVAVRDLVIEGDVRWIVVAPARERTLDEHVREHGPISSARAEEIARVLLAVLVAVHDAGLAHNEIRPHKVLLGEDGAVRLVGVGVRTGNGPDSKGFTTPHSHSGPPKATYDLYSVGATLYWAVTGELYNAYATKWVAPDVSPLLAELLRRLLDWSSRPSAAGALAFLDAGAAAWDAERTLRRRLRKWLSTPTKNQPREWADAPMRAWGKATGAVVLAGIVVLAVLAVVGLAQDRARFPAGLDWFCAGGALLVGFFVAQVVSELRGGPVTPVGWAGQALSFVAGVGLGVLAYVESGPWIAAAGLPVDWVAGVWSVIVIALVLGVLALLDKAIE